MIATPYDKRIWISVQPARKICAGERLVRVARDVEDAVGFPREAAQGGGDVVDYHATQAVQARVAERRQVLRGMAPEDRAAVLAERLVPHVVEAVLDRSPVAAGQFQQTVRAGLGGGSEVTK